MTDYGALLRELALARLVGTANHRFVRDILRRELASRGFVVMEQRFAARPRLPLWGGLRAEGVNLIGVRPRARVATWLVAHYDSKRQAVSMAARLVLAAACGSGVVVGLGHLLAGHVLLASGMVIGSGALFLALSRVADGSPGAVDNASGILAVLASVDALGPDAPVGAIFPDAEEYGLLGAQALVRERANLLHDTAVINFDGVDDRGAPIAFVHRPGPLTDAIARQLGARRWRRLPVLVDGIVLGKAARECVTVMRGNWGTARVVHTPRDKAERLSLVGVNQVARAVAEVIGPTLRAWER